jgi:dipeptidyl aminopeptidase B
MTYTLSLYRYFEAASPSSIERNIYAIHLPASAETEAISEPIALTDNSTISCYTASFSPGAGFYLLSYMGPGVPWQKVVQVGSKGSVVLMLSTRLVLIYIYKQDMNYLLTDNANLNKTLAHFDTPIIVHSTIENEGYGEWKMGGHLHQI